MNQSSKDSGTREVCLRKPCTRVDVTRRVRPAARNNVMHLQDRRISQKQTRGRMRGPERGRKERLRWETAHHGQLAEDPLRVIARLIGHDTGTIGRGQGHERQGRRRSAMRLSHCAEEERRDDMRGRPEERSVWRAEHSEWAANRWPHDK